MLVMDMAKFDLEESRSRTKPEIAAMTDRIQVVVKVRVGVAAARKLRQAYEEAQAIRKREL